MRQLGILSFIRKKWQSLRLKLYQQHPGQVSKAWVPAQLPRAPSSPAQNDSHRWKHNLTFRELHSLKGTLCPFLNQITGEYVTTFQWQTAKYQKKKSHFYIFKICKSVSTHQGTGEELSSYFTEKSCESVKMDKLGPRMPGRIRGGSRWKALPEGGVSQFPKGPSSPQIVPSVPWAQRQPNLHTHWPSYNFQCTERDYS